MDVKVTTSMKQTAEHKVLITGLHEMTSEESNEVLDFMKNAQSSFSEHNIYGDRRIYDSYEERFMIGVIMTRVALNMGPFEELPDGVNEMAHLINARGLNCRANLLRLLTVKLLSSNARERPTFQECYHHISNWEDERMHSFMDRFVNYIKEPAVKRRAARFLDTHYQDLCDSVWFSVERLGQDAYDTILEASLKHLSPGVNDLASRRAVEQRLTTSGPVGLFLAYRNRAQHFFEFMRDTRRYVGDLSRSYLNFWRTRFPLMLSVAWLTAIDLDLYQNPFFLEFFPIRNETHYSRFKNKTVFGSERPVNIVPGL